MRKILLILFLLLITYNVNALECEYKVDHNNIGIVVKIRNDDNGVDVEFSQGYYIMPGQGDRVGGFENIKPDGTCPSKVYYSCNARNFCKINNVYFVESDSVKAGSLELKKQTGGSVSGSPGGGGGSVDSVIEDFRSGNACGAIMGLTDLVDNYVKKPLIILGAVLFFVFTTLEYGKVVFSEDGSFKKANDKTLKRALGFGILALSPFIIELLLTLAGLPVGCGI